MRHRSLKSSSSEGFTLIEVLVVVIMIAALFAIGTPSWLSFINNRRANTTRDEILSALRQAQTEATRSRRPQTMSLNPAADPPTITIRNQTVPLGNGSLTRGMISVQTTIPDNTIRFNSNGALATSMVTPITITVSAPANGNVKRCVIVESLLGAVRTASRGEPGCS